MPSLAAKRKTQKIPHSSTALLLSRLTSTPDGSVITPESQPARVDAAAAAAAAVAASAAV